MTQSILTDRPAGRDGALSIATLRTARAALRQAIEDGAGHLRELHDLVEDELIVALARARREAQR